MANLTPSPETLCLRTNYDATDLLKRATPPSKAPMCGAFGIPQCQVVHNRQSDVVWQYLLLLLRKWPFPFGMCPVCDHVFAQAGRGKPRQYCSNRCKAKGIPSYARRSAYQSERRQRRRNEKLQLARDVIRQTQSEQGQLKELSKELPQKSRRALMQLLNKARLKQRRTKRTKEKKED
jgi:hypothetical protein